jgi:hypothetical protein
MVYRRFSGRLETGATDRVQQSSLLGQEHTHNRQILGELASGMVMLFQRFQLVGVLGFEGPNFPSKGRAVRFGRRAEGKRSLFADLSNNWCTQSSKLC